MRRVKCRHLQPGFEQVCEPRTLPKAKILFEKGKKSFFRKQKSYSNFGPETTISQPCCTHGDFQISESRAIQQLIVRHSKKCELLGGADLKSQAKVQQAMYYEAGNVNTKIVSIVVPVIFGGELDAEKMKETLMPVFAAVDTA